MGFSIRLPAGGVPRLRPLRLRSVGLRPVSLVTRHLLRATVLESFDLQLSTESLRLFVEFSPLPRNRRTTLSARHFTFRPRPTAQNLPGTQPARRASLSGKATSGRIRNCAGPQRGETRGKATICQQTTWRSSRLPEAGHPRSGYVEFSCL